MGAPAKGMKAVDDSTAAEALLSAFEDIAAAERRKHATVFNYWLSIRGDRHFPPIRDLDPLEISDAGPTSVLLELIGGGEDADIRHLGQAIKAAVKVERISEAPKSSLLACIAKQLPLISNSRQALAFKDEFTADNGSTRCWVTLLPFSSSGTYVDYVYGLVSLAEGARSDSALSVDEEPAETIEESVAAIEEVAEEPSKTPEEERVEEIPAPEEPVEVVSEVREEEPLDAAAEEEPEIEPEPVEAVLEPEKEVLEEVPGEVEAPVASERRPGFSKLLDTIASVGGFYGNVVQMDPKLPAQADDIEETHEIEAVEALETVETADQVGRAEHVDQAEHVEEAEQAEQAEQAEHVEEAEQVEQIERVEEPKCVSEGFMQTRLSEVRSKADEARAAKLRANAALYEGLSAAYDFALDAEENAEEYLKLVEAQGLKIQLRSPMKPVVKLAFEGMCDDATISQLETVLAWALKNDLPRGSLAERIEAEGGLGPILSGQTAAAA